MPFDARHRIDDDARAGGIEVSETVWWVLMTATASPYSLPPLVGLHRRAHARPGRGADRRVRGDGGTTTPAAVAPT